MGEDTSAERVTSGAVPPSAKNLHSINKLTIFNISPR